jgi:hypothetical protein
LTKWVLPAVGRRRATGLRHDVQADRDGLDLFTVADHPYFGDKLDAYALTAFLLGQTDLGHDHQARHPPARRRGRGARPAVREAITR